MSDFQDFQAGMSELSTDLGEGTSVLASFTAEMDRMKDSVAQTSAGVASMERSLSSGLRKAFDGVVFDGMKLSDAMRTVATSLANAAYSAAIKPVTNHFGGLLANSFGGLFGGAFENGAAFSSGRVHAFAKGGVVDQATAFPMRGGTGLMGEAGP